MKEILYEPAIEYQTSKWKVDPKPGFTAFKYPVLEADTMVFRKPFIVSTFDSNQERKIKISSLRGKMTKQTAAEIDKQIEELRNEWERGF